MNGRAARRRYGTKWRSSSAPPDYFGIGPNGDRVTKDEAIADRESGRLHWETIDASVLGAAAIASGIWKVKGTLDRRDISGSVRYTRIWHKVDGKLNLVHNQITSVRPPF